MHIARTTTLHVVEAIEPLLPFWRDQLGYAVLVEVPHEDRLGFVLLACGEQHLMLQTHTSLKADVPEVAARKPQSLLYIDVDSLEKAMAKALDGKLLLGPRTTFYGARESFYETASGHIVAFVEVAPSTT